MLRKRVRCVVLGMTSIGCLLAITGCGDSPNRVVGESNGWTIEQVEQAVKEEEKQREMAAEQGG